MSFSSKSLIAKELLKNRFCLRWYLKSCVLYNLWNLVLRTMLLSWNLCTARQSQWETHLPTKPDTQWRNHEWSTVRCLSKDKYLALGSAYSKKLLSRLIFHLSVAVALFRKLQFWVQVCSNCIWQQTERIKNYSIGLNLCFP